MSRVWVLCRREARWQPWKRILEPSQLGLAQCLNTFNWARNIHKLLLLCGRNGLSQRQRAIRTSSEGAV
ncbi:hypothetical protein BC938DRAFT_473227 [Jimgerdemannia flammicorona]|uniref:Uncharacterized protein n=1 Tax=Jimgerdemannia flammicorona TaxID=994334 RepID=A0A433QTF6_9FUNG|nr:hypothetical protein BC938DRAFT_473227 [Jimgerdemannia flammicorona]